jgi:hypothetical protein
METFYLFFLLVIPDDKPHLKKVIKLLKPISEDQAEQAHQNT